MSADGGPVVFANLSDHQKARLVIGFCRCLQYPSIFPKHLGFVEVDAMLGLVFATFFLNRTNVSGILGGGPIGGLDQSGPWKIDARFNKETLSNRIQQIAAYKTRITVSKKDGIAQTNHYLTKGNALIYLDPPYYDKGATLYLNHYKRLDHEALARRLNRNPEGLWLLTYDNNKEIKSLYRHRKVVNFSLNYNAYKS